MVNKTPIANLPSIDEFIVEPAELPSVSQFLPEEIVEEEVQTIEDADGNAFLEVEDIIKEFERRFGISGIEEKANRTK